MTVVQVRARRFAGRDLVRTEGALGAEHHSAGTTCDDHGLMSGRVARCRHEVDPVGDLLAVRDPGSFLYRVSYSLHLVGQVEALA